MKIATLNINHYADKHGRWPARRRAIAESLRGRSPDVVVLQGVRREASVENGENQAAQIARELDGYRFEFSPAVVSDGCEEGQAILSRIKPARVEKFFLNNNSYSNDKKRRMIQCARFETKQGPLHLFNVHFSYDPEQNRQNVTEALPYVGSFPGLAVLAGDFSAPPDSPAAAALKKYGWCDAWASLRGKEKGYTFEAGNPGKRIDYVWVNPDAARLVDRIEIVAPPESGARLSGHLGLCAALKAEPV